MRIRGKMYTTKRITDDNGTMTTHMIKHPLIHQILTIMNLPNTIPTIEYGTLNR